MCAVAQGLRISCLGIGWSDPPVQGKNLESVLADWKRWLLQTGVDLKVVDHLKCRLTCAQILAILYPACKTLIGSVVFPTANQHNT